MVRAPCCEKMGLNKGPWTPMEDQILVAYIQRYGHENWRALPKQAGLLRCGKSCRLRWTNYLRPDIKRGNFSKEEEEAIISLHGMLGNRWSAIAARLPGRTDNEIKNVWHTHLKKRANPDQTVQESKRNKIKIESEPVTSQQNTTTRDPRYENPGVGPLSPAQSCSDISSSGTDSSIAMGDGYNGEVKDETMDSFEEFPGIDEDFWSEVLSMDKYCTGPREFTTSEPIGEPLSSFGVSNDNMSFWLKILIEAGDSHDLPAI